MGDATHGNTLSHRSPGSIGQRQYTGRVFSGKKKCGHRGAVVQRTQRLARVRVEGGHGLVEIKADIFEVGQVVDVDGVTKGTGFQGTIKRWNFKMGDATHGNSLSHLSPGSIGQRQTPGRVFPGKKMSGHMGAVRQSTQRLEVVRVDAERGLIAIKGAVPGAPGGDVIVRPSSKA